MVYFLMRGKRKKQHPDEYCFIFIIDSHKFVEEISEIEITLTDYCL